jgi:preprotein translocase subunit Sec63
MDNIKECPKCGWASFSDAVKCHMCGHIFNIAKEDKKEDRKNGRKEYLKKFVCIICHNEFSVNVMDLFNVFICMNCRSIFLYEWVNGKLIISIVKREEVIPKEIKKLIDYFELSMPITQEALKRNYHKLLSQYHPDKVSHLAKEFKELSEQKTKEIIGNYELLQNWINMTKNK